MKITVGCWIETCVHALYTYMLRYLPPNDPDNELLKNKRVNIVVTNHCNLSCGSCHQLCSLFQTYQPSKLWNIPIEQLDYDIKVLTHSKGTNPPSIGIFGGEPTLHPEWEEILNVVKKHHTTQFDVWTNNTQPDHLVPIPNIRYRLGNKKDTMHRATLVAACDVYQRSDKNFYWNIAHDSCRMWRSCRSVIYDNRAYLCEPAAAFDRLTLGAAQWEQSKGWKVVIGVNPLDQSTNAIAAQGKEFCYRCGFCIEHPLWQKVTDPTLISNSNLALLQNQTHVCGITTAYKPASILKHEDQAVNTEDDQEVPIPQQQTNP